MRRVLVVVAAAVALGGCGYASEVESPTSTTANISASVEDGSAWDSYVDQMEEQAQEAFERQMAEDAAASAEDVAPADLATTTTEPFWKQAGCRAPGDC